MKDKEKQIKFSVIDNKTGEYPDLYKIALKEEWAKGLMYCDMEGFSINEDGQLILSDECGKFVYCPSDRFTVVFENSVVLSKEDYEKLKSRADNKCRYDCDLIDMPDFEREKILIEKTSKETAEKIYNFVERYIMDDAEVELMVKEWFKKQFNVEIKE